MIYYIAKNSSNHHFIYLESRIFFKFLETGFFNGCPIIFLVSIDNLNSDKKQILDNYGWTYYENFDSDYVS